MAQIHCKYDDLLDPKKLKNHPKNRNKHGQDQIDRLSELYEYHGIRHPIIISNLSGFIVAGHGRKLAAIRAGIKEFPVTYQDFESSEAEYAFLQADNAIASWSELDLAAINEDLADLGPDFDLSMLGIYDFTLDFEDKISNTKKIDTTKKFDDFLDSGTRYFQFIYTLQDYEKVQKLLEIAQAEHNKDNFSDTLISILEKNYA